MRRAFLFLCVAGLIALSMMLRAAEADPVRRDLHYASDRWPAGEPPIRLVFLSDVHVGLPDTPPARIARLVARINALRPDCVLIAGDFTSDKMVGRRVPIARAIAPLGGLRPTNETIAVLGNHDGEIKRTPTIVALADAGVNVVANGAVRCGPVTVGGVDDLWTQHADVAATLRSLRLFGGVPILMTHNPDVFPAVRGVGLTLAGHTHCGQISPPLIGPLLTASRFGRRYACGLVRERGMTLLVTAGIGTSGLPLRWNAPPEYWVITVGPRARG